QRDVLEGDDGRDPVLMARCQHPSIVVQLGLGELTFGWLDSCPLDAEPEAVEAKTGHERQVLAEAVVEVARVTRSLQARSPVLPLPLPPAAVDVATFDLVGARRGADEEALGELAARHRSSSLSRTRSWGPGGHPWSGRPVLHRINWEGRAPPPNPPLPGLECSRPNG